MVAESDVVSELAVVIIEWVFELMRVVVGGLIKVVDWVVQLLVVVLKSVVELTNIKYFEHGFSTQN